MATLNYRFVGRDHSEDLADGRQLIYGDVIALSDLDFAAYPYLADLLDDRRLIVVPDPATIPPPPPPPAGVQFVRVDGSDGLAVLPDSGDELLTTVKAGGDPVWSPSWYFKVLMGEATITLTYAGTIMLRYGTYVNSQLVARTKRNRRIFLIVNTLVDPFSVKPGTEDDFTTIPNAGYLVVSPGQAGVQLAHTPVWAFVPTTAGHAAGDIAGYVPVYEEQSA